MLQVRQILNDGRPFGEHLPVIELQRGHGPLGIDGEEVDARRGLLRLQIDLFAGERQAGLEQYDMRRERAGSRRIIEFHGQILLTSIAQKTKYSQLASAL